MPEETGLPESFAGSLQRGRFRYFPVVPGRLEFAIELRQAMLRERPQVVALELPTTLREGPGSSWPTRARIVTASRWPSVARSPRRLRSARRSVCLDCYGRVLRAHRVLPIGNAWHGLASTGRRISPNAPIARWSAPRWRGAGRDNLRIIPRTRGSITTGANRYEKFAFVQSTSGAAYGSRRSRGRLAEGLPVLIHRFALLDERRHAFGAILQREGGVKQVALDVQPL